MWGSVQVAGLSADILKLGPLATSMLFGAPLCFCFKSKHAAVSRYTQRHLCANARKLERLTAHAPTPVRRLRFSQMGWANSHLTEILTLRNKVKVVGTTLRNSVYFSSIDTLVVRAPGRAAGNTTASPTDEGPSNYLCVSLLLSVSALHGLLHKSRTSPWGLSCRLLAAGSVSALGSPSGRPGKSKRVCVG